MRTTTFKVVLKEDKCEKLQKLWESFKIGLKKKATGLMAKLSHDWKQRDWYFLQFRNKHISEKNEKCQKYESHRGKKAKQGHDDVEMKS